MRDDQTNTVLVDFRINVLERYVVLNFFKILGNDRN